MTNTISNCTFKNVKTPIKANLTEDSAPLVLENNEYIDCGPNEISYSGSDEANLSEKARAATTPAPVHTGFTLRPHHLKRSR